MASLQRLAALAATAALAAACTGGGSASPPGSDATPGAAPASAAVAATAGAATAGPATERPAAFTRNPAPISDGATYTQRIDPADFVAVVDHPFLPLKRGTRFVFEGDERIEVTVLPETKLILGVATTVLRDQVFIDGVLEEDTLDWYAQDRDGNVWYFGEKTAELDKDGKVTSTAGSWEGGVDAA
ncbi:MAG: hypothetical protein ABIZ52_04235, partial [Candidatus Limnocylindrales bacterium]